MSVLSDNFVEVSLIGCVLNLLNIAHVYCCHALLYCICLVLDACVLLNTGFSRQGGNHADIMVLFFPFPSLLEHHGLRKSFTEHSTILDERSGRSRGRFKPLAWFEPSTLLAQNLCMTYSSVG